MVSSKEEAKTDLKDLCCYLNCFFWDPDPTSVVKLLDPCNFFF